MTKKPSEKNKAWEKDRRDRLNKSFENLSKLLPNYDPSTIWTKIEIIQKSIIHIEDLHDKYEKCLAAKDPETLNLLKGLTDAIQYFQCRNKQICDILKDKKINLPALNLPKFLIEHPHYNIENHADIENTKDPKCSSTIKKRKDKTSVTASNKNKITKPISSSTGELNPTKDQEKGNSVQLNQPQSCQSNNTVLLPIQQPLTPNLIQISSTTSNPFVLNKNKNGKIFLLSKPEIKVYFSRSDGKIPIPVIKKYVPLPKKRNRKNNTNRKMKENQEMKIVRRKKKLSEISSKVLKCKLKEDCAKGNQTIKNVPLEKNNSRSLSPTAAFLQSFPVVAQKTIDTDILCDLASNTVSNMLVKPKDKGFGDVEHIVQQNESDSKIKSNCFSNVQTTHENDQNVTTISNDLPINITSNVMKPFFTSSYTTSCNNSKTKLLNLSTQKPICTPLPLDNKGGEDLQNLTKPQVELFKNNNQQNNFRTIFGEQYAKSDSSATKSISSSNSTHLNNTFKISSTAQLNTPKSSTICNKSTHGLFQNTQYSTQYITNTPLVPPISTNNSELNNNTGNLLYTPQQSNVSLDTTLIQSAKKVSSLPNQEKISKDYTGNSNLNFTDQAKGQNKISESNENTTKVIHKYIQPDCATSTEKSNGKYGCLNYINSSLNVHPSYIDNSLQLPSHPNSYKTQNEQKPTYISYSEILNVSGQNNTKSNASKITTPYSSSHVQPSDQKQNVNNSLMQNHYLPSEKQKTVAKSLEHFPRIAQGASCATTQSLNLSINQDFTMLNSTTNNGYIGGLELATNTNSNKIFEQKKKADCSLNTKNLSIEPKLNLTFNEEFKPNYSNTGTINNIIKYNADTTTLSNHNSISSCNSNPFMLRPYNYANNTTQSFGASVTENLAISSNSSLPVRNFPSFTGSSCNNKMPTYENIQTSVTSNSAYPITNSTSNEPESIFSKNYYYPPVAVQPETTFSFNLNTSQPDYFHTSTNLFTFSLTPTTNSFLPSKLNEPIQNYTDLINQSCQSTATNFTFSLTTPISSITQSDKIDSVHNNFNENCPKYFDQQFYQNNTTNFTFALTKTTETVSSHNAKTENVENNKIINHHKTKVNSQIPNQNKNEATYSNSNQFYYDCGQQDYSKLKDQTHETQKTHENWITPSDCNKKNENWNYKLTPPVKPTRTDHNFKVPSSIDAFNKNPKTIKTSQNNFSVSQLVHDCGNYQSTATDLNSQENKKNALIKEKKNNIPVDSFAEQKFYNYSAESLISKKEKHKINTVPNCNVGNDFYPQNSFTYNNVDDNYSNSYLSYNQEEYTNNDFTKNNKCLLNKKGQQTNFHQPVGSYDSGNYIQPPPPPALGSEYYSHNYYSNNNNISTFNNNWTNHQSNEVNNSSGNLTNFYLSSICPEINEKNNAGTNWQI